MITVGFSTRENKPEYIELIKSTCMYKDVDVIQKINTGDKSLPEVYNEILEEAKTDIVVFIHDDLEFDTKNWGDKVMKHFKRNPTYGILGLAGTKYLPKSGM